MEKWAEEMVRVEMMHQEVRVASADFPPFRLKNTVPTSIDLWGQASDLHCVLEMGRLDHPKPGKRYVTLSYIR